VSAAASHSVAKSKVNTATTADDEDRTMNAVQESTVSVEPSSEHVAVPPAGVSSPYATDKPLPTANGPTSRVVTRPSLSRTLDLSTNICVDAATGAPEVKAELPPPSDATESAISGIVRKLLLLYQYDTSRYNIGSV